MIQSGWPGEAITGACLADTCTRPLQSTTTTTRTATRPILSSQLVSALQQCMHACKLAHVAITISCLCLGVCCAWSCSKIASYILIAITLLPLLTQQVPPSRSTMPETAVPLRRPADTGNSAKVAEAIMVLWNAQLALEQTVHGCGWPLDIYPSTMFDQSCLGVVEHWSRFVVGDPRRHEKYPTWGIKSLWTLRRD